MLKRSFQEQVEYVIADPTEMPRPHARHTSYVGLLSDSTNTYTYDSLNRLVTAIHGSISTEYA
jgi:hypothetical protein